VLMWMTSGGSGTSVMPASVPTWLPSVVSIETSRRVDFRVKMGEEMSTMGGESVHTFQMTERWNEEIVGTGGRGLKMLLLCRDVGER